MVKQQTVKKEGEKERMEKMLVSFRRRENALMMKRMRENSELFLCYNNHTNIRTQHNMPYGEICI